MKTFEDYLESASIPQFDPLTICHVKDAWDARQPEIDEHLECIADLVDDIDPLKKENEKLKIKLNQEQSYLISAQKIIQEQTGLTMPKIKDKIELEAMEFWIESLNN